MLPPTHLAIGYLLFHRQPRWACIAGLAGAFCPDLFNLAFIVNLWLKENLSWSFGLKAIWFLDLWFSQMLHSIFFWLAISALIYFWPSLKFFILGVWSHLFLDLLTHENPWSWNHFWPIEISPLNGLVDYKSWLFFAFVDLPIIFLAGYFFWRGRSLNPNKKPAPPT